MSPGLDSVIGGLRDHEGIEKKARVGVNTDEIVIRCDYAIFPGAESCERESAEADDLIWWSWDGKIVGFGDL